MRYDYLPAKYQMYTLEVRSQSKPFYTITGETKEKIMRSGAQFVELPTGEVINKSFMIGITRSIEETKDSLNKLPEQELKLLENRNGIDK